MTLFGKTNAPKQRKLGTTGSGTRIDKSQSLGSNWTYRVYINGQADGVLNSEGRDLDDFGARHLGVENICGAGYMHKQ
jgi:hypothetical protein